MADLQKARASLQALEKTCELIPVEGKAFFFEVAIRPAYALEQQLKQALNDAIARENRCYRASRVG
jgi:hypothetical protein